MHGHDGKKKYPDELRDHAVNMVLGIREQGGSGHLDCS